MKTPVTDMFGIEFPILAFSHCRDVVAAVSRAGGLGVLGAVGHSDEALEVDLNWIEDEVGDRPYGIDLIVPARYAGDGEGGLKMVDIVAMIPDEHREFLDELLDRYDVPADEAVDQQPLGGLTGGSAAAPFSARRRATARPMPLPPPVTTTPRPSRLMPSSGLSCDFEKTSRSHAAADAHRDYHIAGTAPAPLDQRVPREPGAGHPIGVSNGDRAAAHVEPLHGDAELVATVHDLNRKGFVELPEVDVVHADAGPLKQTRHR